MTEDDLEFMRGQIYGLYLVTTLALLVTHGKEFRETFANLLDKVGPTLPLEGQSRSALFDSGSRDVFPKLAKLLRLEELDILN